MIHRVESGRPVTYEPEEGDAEEVDGETVVAAITDRRLLLGSPESPIEVPYRDVREVTASAGLLRSHIDVRVWNRGRYRVRPARGEDVEAAAGFLEEAATVWQRVLAALEDTREHITDLGEAIEAGEPDAIDAARDDVQHCLSLAARRIDDGPDELRETLESAVAETETELQRTRVHAYLARGQALADEAENRAHIEAWQTAEEALHVARQHLETALGAAVERDFGLVSAIQDELDALDERARRIADRQLDLLKDAREAAVAADAPEIAVPAWSAALEHARGAARFDWGGRLGLDRDRANLARLVEVTAGRLIQARSALAGRLRGDAELARLRGDRGAAADRYEAALSQLVAAERVARELQAGDADRIAARRADMASTYAALRALEDDATVAA